MRSLEFTFRREGELLIGHLNDYPDYETQGFSRVELVENLFDLFNTLNDSLNCERKT